MSISLAAAGLSLTLPDLTWDDVSWSGIRAATEYSAGGVLLQWQGDINGQPVDLSGAGPIPRDDLQALMAFARVKRLVMTLSYEGTEYQVEFRHEEPPVVSAIPIIDRPNKGNDDQYTNLLIKLRIV